MEDAFDIGLGILMGFIFILIFLSVFVSKDDVIKGNETIDIMVTTTNTIPMTTTTLTNEQIELRSDIDYIGNWFITIIIILGVIFLFLTLISQITQILS